MDKPTKKTRVYYDYHECRDYLQQYYNYDERDFANRYHKQLPWNKDEPTDLRKRDESRPHLDFWHWLVDTYGIHNGSFVTFSRKELELDKGEGRIEDWQARIYQWYLDHFAENGEVEFYIEW